MRSEPASSTYAVSGAVNGAGELLQLLRDETPRTRAELAKLTGLARSTVGARVDALLATGLLAPSGEAASTGGRPPVRFAFNPEARVVVGADLGAPPGRSTRSRTATRGDPPSTPRRRRAPRGRGA